MATPGGKKPNKQQINDAGNEVGLDLANAIGKAVSRALSSYDFTPLSKNIVKSIGKVDISAILKTDDAKIKQLAANAKSTLENSIGNIKIGTEIDNDKLASVQKTLQQLSDLSIKASVASVDTSTIDKELAQIKPADIQAIVSSVDSSLIDSEVNKIKPIDLLAKINSIDSSLIDTETGNLKPIDLQAIVGSVDASLVDTEFGKLKIADLQALVTEVDTSLVGEEINKLNPLALQALVTEIDTSALDKLPSAQINATVGEIQKPTRSVEELFGTPEINPKIGKIDFDPSQLTQMVDVMRTGFMRLNTTLSLMGATMRKEISSSPLDQLADGVEEVNTKSNKAGSGFKAITDELKKITSIFARAFDAGLVNATHVGIGKLRRETISLENDFSAVASSAQEINKDIQKGNKDLHLTNLMGADRAKVYASLQNMFDSELRTIAETLNIQKAQELSTVHLKRAISERLVELDKEKAINEVLLQSYEEQEETVGDVVRNTSSLLQNLTNNQKVSQMLVSDAGLYSNWMGKSTAITAEAAQLYEELNRASKQELITAAQKLKITDADKLSKQELVGLIGEASIGLAEQNKVIENTVSSYGDMEKSMKQVIADNKLKTIIVKTGLTGEYAETARLLQQQNELGLLKDNEYQTAIAQLKAEHHIYEERAKQLEITESLATWQLGLKEELEEYGKSWEKLKSKIKAIVTDKEVLKSFLSVKGLETLQEGFKETKEVFSEFRKEGLTVSQATKEMGLALGATFSLSGMSLKENAEIMAGMREQMGSMHHITSDTVTEVGKMAKTFGISAAEAGKLQGQFQNMPGATAESATNTLEFAGNLAKAAHVAPGDVMKDIAGSTEDVARFTKDGGKNVASAAVAARKLGVEFGTLTKMADGLLDFESSINKQMEASVLLGREINLDKAREAALNGDILGATQEMLANVGGEAEFNKMNVAQRKALADAMGVSVADLSKMVKHQDELASLTEEQQMALATGEVTMDEILANAGGVADRFKDAGLGAIGLLTSISQIRQGMTDSIGLVKDFAGGFKAAREEGGGLFSGIKEGFKGLVGFGKGVEAIPGAGGLTEKAADVAKDKVTEKATGLAEDKAGDLASKAAEKVPEGAGKSTGGLTGAIEKIDAKKLLAGGAAMLMVAGAVFVFAKAAQEFASVSWGDLGKAIVGMLALVGALAAVGAIMLSGVGAAAILAGAGAMLIMAAALFVLGKAIQEIGKGFEILVPTLLQLTPLGTQLVVLGAGLMVAGYGLIAFGAGALMATPGILAFGAAMAIAGPAITQLAVVIGDILIKAMEKLPAIINAVSAGFVTIFSTLAQNWQILIPVGIGLASVAIGLGALGLASVVAFPGLVLASIGLGMMQVPLLALTALTQSGVIPQFTQSLLALGTTGPGLLITSVGLLAIGAGLLAVGAAGFIAFPGLALASAGLIAFSAGALIATPSITALGAAMAIQGRIELWP